MPNWSSGRAAAGLATRTRDETDRRRWLVALTDVGRTTTARADALIDGLGTDMFADLEPDRRRELGNLLGLLNSGTSLADLADDPNR